MIAALVAGCSTGTASYDDAVSITPPTFAPMPRSPAASPQLDAIVLRDTDGLMPDGVPPDPAVLAAALTAVDAQLPDIELVSDLYFDDENVWMTVLDPDSSSRVHGVYWWESNGLSIGEPTFLDDEQMFSLDVVDVDAIGALVDGLTERFPTLVVDMPRLSTDLSYRLGLSWRMDLDDARGTLATVYADLDGTVIAVDPGWD